MTKKRSLSWIYEAPLFYLALMALQRGAFPADPAFRSVNPSPLWLGVLLFGLRYGLAAGMSSGALSGVLLALGAGQAGEGFRLHDSDFYLLPGLFVFVGAALGAVADHFAHALYALKLHQEDLEGRNRGLQSQIHSQQKAMRAIEQQVVSQMSSVVTLYHGSRELGTLDRAALMPAMLEFFTRALQATKASLYVPRDGVWELLGAQGWAKPDEYPAKVALGQGVIGRAAAEGRVVSLKESLSPDGALLQEGRDAIVAAPVLDPSGAPVAVFAVQAMPFLRFNSAAVNLLALLTEWGGDSLARCIKVEGLRARSLLDEDLGVHNAKYLEARVDQEMARSKRYALPLSLLLFKVGAEGPAARRPALLAAVAGVLKEIVRNIDIVARSPHDGSDLAILLPTTTRERAEEIAERARAAVARLELPAEMRAGLGAYRAGMTRKEEIIGEAIQALG